MSDELLTTREAAQLAGVTPAALRSVSAKLRANGVELQASRDLWPDARSARYSRSAVVAWRAQTSRRAGA